MKYAERRPISVARDERAQDNELLLTFAGYALLAPVKHHFSGGQFLNHYRHAFLGVGKLQGFSGDFVAQAGDATITHGNADAAIGFEAVLAGSSRNPITAEPLTKDECWERAVLRPLRR